MLMKEMFVFAQGIRVDSARAMGGYQPVGALTKTYHCDTCIDTRRILKTITNRRISNFPSLTTEHSHLKIPMQDTINEEILRVLVISDRTPIHQESEGRPRHAVMALLSLEDGRMTLQPVREDRTFSSIS